MALDTYGIALQVRSDLGVAQSGLNKMQGSTKDLIMNFAKVAGLATSFTAVLMTLKRELIASYQASLKLNEGLANIATIVPNNTERILEFKDMLKNMSVESGKSLNELTDGLYDLISTFGDSAEVQEQFNIVNRIGIAGMASTSDALLLLSAVTKAYGDTSAQTMKKVSDLSFQTVNYGVVTIPELANSIQTVTDSSNRMGVSLEELFTGFATLTGVSGNAAEVATQLRAVLVALEGPSADLAKMYAELGVASGKSLIEQYGFQGALKEIIDYSNRTGVGLQALFGRVQAMSAAFNLGESQAESYAWKLEELKKSSGSTDNALAEMTDGINAQGFQLKQLKAQWEVLRTEMGDSMQPIMDGVIRGLTQFVALLGGNKTAVYDLENATTKLFDISANYQQVLNRLSGDTSELTEKELILLNTRKELLAHDLRIQFIDMQKEYQKTEQSIDDLHKKEQDLQTIWKARNLVLSDSIEAQRRLQELNNKTKRTDQEEVERTTLMKSIGADRIMLQRVFLDGEKELVNTSKELNETEFKKISLIEQVAQAVADGTMNIDAYESINKELYDTIMDTVKALNAQNDAIITPVSAKINPQAIIDSFIGFDAKQLKNQLSTYQALLRSFDESRISLGTEDRPSATRDFYVEMIDKLIPMITETEKEYVDEQKKSFEYQIKQLDATGELGKLNVEEEKVLAEINDIIGENAELTGLVNSLFEKQRDIIKETYEQQIDDQLFAVQNENELLDIERQRDQALKNLNKEGLATEENINNINILYDSMRDKTLENTKEQLKYRLQVSEGLSEAEKIELDRQREIEETNAKYGEQIELLAIINAYYDNLQEKLEENTSLYDKMEEKFSNAIGKKGYTELDKFGKTIVKVGKFVQGFSMIWSSLSATIDSYHDAQRAQMQAEIEGLQRSYDEKRKLADEQIDDIEDEHDERLDALQEMYDSDTISYEDYIARKNQIDENAKTQKEQAEKAAIQAENDLKMAQYESEKAQFEIDKKTAISNSIIAGAQGIMQAWALGPIAGAIGSVIIAAATGYQISQIQSQPAPQPPVLTPLATGGVVTSPTQALIGEGGEPEVVVPLSKAKDFGFGGGGDTFYITGNSFVGTGGLDDLIRMIDKRKTVLARGNRI